MKTDEDYPPREEKVVISIKRFHNREMYAWPLRGEKESGASILALHFLHFTSLRSVSYLSFSVPSILSILSLQFKPYLGIRVVIRGCRIFAIERSILLLYAIKVPINQLP